MKRKFFWLLGFLGLTALFLIYPAAMAAGVQITTKYALEMLWIFPPILVLMGLADVWVPNTVIDTYLGEQSGLKGVLLAIILGTLPTGPVYMAFPIAAELIRKKAGITNIMIFLGVWASLKIPQIGVEIQFLGLKFAALRFILTLTAILISSFAIGALHKQKEAPGKTTAAEK
ncbi:MAG: hypothetical protein GX335_08565 [Firmicutes bacterium]|nr:hypothetical protein [Bacillota bacterium]